ncbi:MAG: hypothetical protein ACYSSL_08220 [Planctomycetota bacterium]|jgi:molecular chaperone GrpE (heat shock protein)
MSHRKVKNFLTLGLILLAIGVAVWGWGLVKRKKELHQLEAQLEMLDSDSASAESGDGTGMSFDFSTDVLREQIGHEASGRNLTTQEKIGKLLFYASVTCMVLGATIVSYLVLLWIARLLSTSFSDPRKSSNYIQKQAKITPAGSPAETCRDESEEGSKSKPKFAWKNEATCYYPAKDAEEINVLLCDEKSVKPKEKEESGDDPTDLNVKVFDQLEESIRQTVLSGYRKNALRVEGSFKTQTENLEKQFTEVKQMTEAVKEAAFEYSKPLSTNIEELMQQITAIRDYASGQQGRIEKLQDGYDWNIIRTFCLRVIRCIDNLDNRIRLKFEEGIQTGELEEIRDELLFALESSGVEQFEPEVNSDFTGKEKLAEVIKEKEYSKDPDMKGKIARIIKHGYRYVIDDGNTKVVRAARVKLFG